MDALLRCTRQITAAPKGIVAIDTPAAAIATRLRSAGLAPTEPMAREFRRVLVRSAALARFASGVVLRPDDLDLPVDGTTATEFLWRSGVVVGVRVDTGLERGLGPEDRVTSGLDGLADRLRSARDAGARFALWSVWTGLAVDGLSSLTVNSQAAARFARTCQSAGLVPVVRVGARMPDGPQQARSAALGAALLSVVGHLEDLEADLAATVVNTVHTGARTFADSPLAMLPAHLGGVALNVAPGAPPPPDAPWPIVFYVGREVTLPALLAWGGRPSSVPAAAEALAARLERLADPRAGAESVGAATVTVLAPRKARRGAE
ncbi:MAG: class I fructose-bisphosphate aldolase [Pseudonocardia sp.]